MLKKRRSFFTIGLFMISLVVLYLKRWYFRLEWRTPILPIPFKGEVYRGELILIACVSIFIICFWNQIVHKSSAKFYTVIAVLMPFFSMVICQIAIEKYGFKFFPFRYFIINIVIFAAVYSIVLLFSNSLRFSMLFASLILSVFSVINAYVTLFRDKSIYPFDFYSISTAAEVSGQYDWKPTAAIVVAILIEIAICVVWTRCKVDLPSNFRIISLFLCIGFVMGSYLSLNHLQSFNFDRDSNGYSLNFVYALNNLTLKAPKSYSLSSVKEIADQYGPFTSGSNDDLPENVIVIMNESWSDITSLGDFTTTEDTFSYYNSISKNAIKADLYVSVSGGGTPNSEYEFLTGNTVAALPEGAIAYQMYLNEHFPSLVSLFSDLGYETVSYHPEKSSNYGRKQIYTYLGFDKSFWDEDFAECEGDIYYRYLLSDQSDYRHLIDIYEEKENDRLFIFNVTAQSHGGYGYPEFDSFVTTEGLNNSYTSVNEYCTLTKLTDDALAELISYFSEVDEKTLILVFGDHQPTLETAFYNEIGEDSSSPNRYVTKMLLWANYDLNTENAQNAYSANYLSLLLLEKMGIKPSGYYSFLQALHTEYPVISYKGCYDKNGNFSSYKDAVSFSSLLSDYNSLQFNYLHNPSDRIQNFFWEK